MRTLIRTLLILFLPLLAFQACGGGGGGGEESPTPEQPKELVLNQQMLDGATVTRAVKSGVHLETRPDFSGSDRIPINPRLWSGDLLANTDPNQYIRSVTSTSGSGAMAPGTVFATHVYEKNGEGGMGKLVNVGVMVKHPAGYFPAGGDWEYILIDPGTVSDTKPNGLVDRATFRGKQNECADCHSRAGRDFIFSN